MVTCVPMKLPIRAQWVSPISSIILIAILLMGQQSTMVSSFASNGVTSRTFRVSIPHNSHESRSSYGVDVPMCPNLELSNHQSSACVIPSQRKNHHQQHPQYWSSIIAASILSASLMIGPLTAFAENELSAKYGKGLDTSLVDQSCLVNHCGNHATACLKDDPSCRKGLTCTAKCLGDNACITGCMARYGNRNLDNLLKCTIEDHECIKVAILPGGADPYGAEPRAPAPTVQNFDMRSLEGSWYKVVGYNPNYDCYACQRNSFSTPEMKDFSQFVSNTPRNNQLRMDVEFSMPHLLPDGSPPLSASTRERIFFTDDGGSSSIKTTAESIGLNRYATHETMIFDSPASSLAAKRFQLPSQTISYARTAHSEGEMFGLKFWENWYIIGENDPGDEEFKFVYYNGKTRQNTYEGAFIYSRTPDLSPESMKKVYLIAKNAGMNPDQFCRIKNRGCFPDVENPASSSSNEPKGAFRGILASTRVSQLLGVEPVAARDTLRQKVPTASILKPVFEPSPPRPWWNELGDYLENPHRHFAVMNSLRQPVEWPRDIP